MERFKPKDWYCTAAYIYIFLPFVIFVLGWVRLVYALPLALCTGYGVYRMLRSLPKRERFSWDGRDKERFAWIAVIILVWIAMSGIGGYVFQNQDHMWRNAMFETLVREKWPVVKVLLKDGVRETRGFSYYLGFWMAPALAGKLFGLEAGYFCQAVWAYIGVMLFYYGICILRKKIEVWPLLVFIIFSGADILGYYLMGWDIAAVPATEHLEWWTSFQFTSMTAQLFWVFNQAIPAWLITAVLLLQKDNRHVFFILSAALISCTLPAVGMLPLCIYRILDKGYGAERSGRQWFRRLVREVVTVENVLCGGLVVIVSALFLKRPMSGSSEGRIFTDLSNGGWFVILVFLAVEIGGICAAVYREQKKNPFFYLMIAWLCLCPLLEVYGEGNFCMRASIPALIVLYLYMTGALEHAYRRKDWKHLAAVLLVLAVGAVTPLHEVVRTVSETAAVYQSADEKTRRDSVGIAAVLDNPYESVNVVESVFYMGFAR